MPNEAFWPMAVATKDVRAVLAVGLFAFDFAKSPYIIST
jgi:hypothetical protein